MDHQVTPSSNDFVRPGEQWFFYWKTSAALWESKILQIPSHEVIFLPLYWGFHADSPQHWDFGETHPERDLLRLTQIMTQHGRKFCWLLPLTPSPFLPNGGVPTGAARTLSITREGTHIAVLDHESKLNKVYSYFEPKVFQAFIQFVSAFGKFLAEKNIKSQVWGVQFSFQDSSGVRSYMEDSSLVFEQGFSRYLKKNNPEGISFSTPEEEELSKATFLSELQSLFMVSAESALAPFWQGVQKIIMLGGSPHETIERSLQQGKTQLVFFQDIFLHFARNEWISSALLRPEEKKGLLTQVLNEHFGRPEIEERYHYRVPAGELDQEWRAYGIVQIIGAGRQEHWQRVGLIDYLNDQFRWMYQMHDELRFTTEWIESTHHMVKIFSGKGMDRTSFGQMLKLFMMGQRVILDISGLSPELEKRLQVFYLENNLSLQQVNYLTSINLCELGEGRFITFEGDKLLAAPERKNFWKNLFRWFKLTQPEVLMDQEVFGLWRIRATSPEDLNFLDVRRFSVYNPTSYKKQVTVHTQKHFAFMKMNDPQRAQAKTTPEGVEVELLPGGKVSLDFGHYEES